MRKALLSLFTLLFIVACSSSVPAAESKSDHHKTESRDLVGQIDKASLLQEPYSAWYEKNYSNYTPDENSLMALEKMLNEYQIKAFMGTWCHDSQRETPRLIKILESTNYDLDNLDLVALNWSKQTPEQYEKGLDIQRTPTFIIYQDNKEIGRIVETPRESLEQDILKIITGQEYKHSYQD